MNDLLLPIYLFVVYLAIACWLRAPIKIGSIKSKPKAAHTIKGILLPPRVRDPIVLDLEEAETLDLKPKRQSRSKRTIKDLIQTAAA